MLAGATTAFAADNLNINFGEYGLTLPRALPGPVGARVLHVEVAHDLAGHVPSATLTVDTSGVAGVADVTWPKQCTHTGATGTCKVDHVDDLEGPQSLPTYMGFGLTAAAGAKDGAQGSIKFGATAPGVDSTATTADISVGDGTDMVIHQLTPVDHAKVGSTVPAHIAWANLGNTTAPSTVLTLQTMAGLDFTQRFSNCAYSKPAGAGKVVTAVCTIDTPLRPGDALQLSPDLKMKVTSQAWYTMMTAQVLPPTEQNKASRSAAQAGTPGNGPRLTATPIAASRITPQVKNINESDSYTELVVHADNHAHYSAIGANVHADKGATVPVTVGLRNSGPALIYDRSGGDGIDALLVTFPKGTTATTVPDDCYLPDKAVKGTGPYECSTRDEIIQAPGFKATFTFNVRVDQQVTNARGTAALTNEMADYTGKPVTFPWDNSTRGYSAPIVFNGPVTTTAPGADAGGTGSANAPGTDGQSQNLAATGGGSHTTLITATAGAVLVAGAGILIVSRRRKAALQR
jgi:hypothetical protein